VKHHVRIAAVCAATTLAFSACGSSDDESSSGAAAGGGSGDKPTIAMTTYSRSFEFYQDIEKGAQSEAQGKADLLLKDPNGDLAAQTANIEDFVSRNVDLVAVVPIDSAGAAAEGQMVTAAKIPLMTVDIAIADDVGQKTHIASDNIEGGKIAATKMAELLKGKGKVAIINNPAITSVVDREKGFKEEASKTAGLEVVASQSGDSKREKAQAVAEDLLQKYPDLKGIFAVNDEMALGALQAVIAAGRDDMSIIGFDASAEGLKEIKSGTSPFKASVAQDPVHMGEVVVETALQILNGESVPAAIPVPVTLVDAKNVDEHLGN
jgi:ribose transport system substrate-binding protein